MLLFLLQVTYEQQSRVQFHQGCRLGNSSGVPVHKDFISLKM